MSKQDANARYHPISPKNDALFRNIVFRRYRSARNIEIPIPCNVGQTSRTTIAYTIFIRAARRLLHPFTRRSLQHMLHSLYAELRITISRQSLCLLK